MYEYLIGDLIFLAIWLILYFIRNDLRRKMLFSSLLSAPLGLTEIFFIPWYWNPKTLFNLVPGIESILFAFSVGGVSAVLYEVILNKHLIKAREKRTETKKHYYILICVCIASFFLFSIIFKKDVIYSAIISMFLGAITIILIRGDLAKETVIGGILFLMTYFVMFFIMNAFILPGFVAKNWNFEHLIGSTIFGIPIEELLWAWGFGSLWAPIYEDAKGYAIK